VGTELEHDGGATLEVSIVANQLYDRGHVLLLVLGARDDCGL
jgi:hypothetical protein